MATVIPVQNDSCNFFLTPIPQPAHGTVVDNPIQSGQAWDYTPAKDYNGPDANTYQGSIDGTVGDTATVSYTITPVNDPPKFFGITNLGTEDQPAVAHNLGLVAVGPGNEAAQTLAITVTASDPSVFAVQPAASNVAIAGGALRDWDLSWTPARDWCGSTPVTVRFKDDGGTANGGADTLIVVTNIQVTCVNDAPVATSDQYGVKPGQTLSVPSAAGVLANDTDVDSALLKASQAALPTHGALFLLANGSFTYIPVAGFAGTDSFTYTATDGVLTAPATVTIRVDGTAPLLAGRSPASGAMGVARDVQPAVTFDEPVQAASVTTSSLKLKDVAAGTLVAGTSSVVGGRLRFLPATLLGAGRSYRLYATSEITDLAGNAFAGTSWTFTVTSDATRPTVTGKQPAPSATGISRTANVHATFSEAVRASTVSQATVRLRDSVTGSIITAVVSYDSTRKRASVDPSITLTARRTYIVLVSSGIRDRAGNRLFASSWSFKTGS